MKVSPSEGRGDLKRGQFHDTTYRGCSVRWYLCLKIADVERTARSAESRVGNRAAREIERVHFHTCS